MSDAAAPWQTHPNGANKTIGEMTESQRRPLLRAAFLRSKMSAVPELADTFKEADLANTTTK